MGQKRNEVRRMSVEEFLEWEERSPFKHEYVAGEVFAISGTTIRHGLIVTNIAMALRGHARARRCSVVMNDLMLRASDDRCYYPDVLVFCGQVDDLARIISEPSVVVEVTSPSTRGTDRREKLDAYLRIGSLGTYLIVEQERRHVVAYMRDASRQWERAEFERDGGIEILALEMRLTLDQIYDDIKLAPLTLKEDEEWEKWSSDPAAYLTAR